MNVAENTTYPTEIRDAGVAARGYWAIIRKGKRTALPRTRRFRLEVTARAAWKRLDVRQGLALLIDPSGCQVERQSGPWGVRGRGRW